MFAAVCVRVAALGALATCTDVFLQISRNLQLLGFLLSVADHFVRSGGCNVQDRRRVKSFTGDLEISQELGRFMALLFSRHGSNFMLSRCLSTRRVLFLGAWGEIGGLAVGKTWSLFFLGLRCRVPYCLRGLEDLRDWFLLCTLHIACLVFWMDMWGSQMGTIGVKL